MQNVSARVAYFAIIGFREQSVWGKGGGLEFVCLGLCLCAHSESDRNEPLVAYYGLTQETIGILGNAPE